MASGTAGPDLMLARTPPPPGSSAAVPPVPLPELGRAPYRADIDGLRAIAVMSVVLFHAGVLRFNGGYVGVDIFFVISGYLITQVIREQVQRGRFSVLGFYERRFRRIFPALIAALSLTSAMSWYYLMPEALQEYAGSLVAAILSVSNIHFWLHSSYFDLPSASQPLLQTWSLAVEEQFYVVLPLLLLGLARWRRGAALPVLGSLAALSLVASEAIVRTSPETAFYMLHTRAWELLLGGLLAYGAVPPLRSALLRNVLGALGLALILGSILLYSTSMRFPGSSALPPCLGTALVIAAGRDGGSIAGRLLSLRPVVFVGLISYSVYLLHWPLVVFQRSDSLLVTGSPMVGKLAMIAASLVLGALSWRFIERPFRRPGFLRRGQVFALAGLGVLVVMAQALALRLAPPRYSPEVAAMAAHLHDSHAHMREGSCFISSGYRFGDFKPDQCLVAAPGRGTLLVLGDSHAAHLVAGLQQAFPERSVLQATAVGCKPVLADRRGYRACNELMGFIFDQWLPAHPVQRLLLAGRWAEADLGPLAQTLDWARARGIAVTLAGPVPQYDSALPRLLALALHRKDAGLPARHRTPTAALDRQLAALAARSGAGYISFEQLLCPGEECRTLAPDGTPLELDDSHFTAPGSRFVGEAIRAAGLIP